MTERVGSQDLDPYPTEQSGPLPRPGILDIKPYVPGRSGASNSGPIYKLSANESALGASPKARAAFEETAQTLSVYPDGDAALLRSAIAQTYGLDADQIVCGAGSDEILQLLAKAFLGPDDTIVQSEHGFLVYSLAALACGAQTIKAPETRLTASVDALADAVDDTTRIVFLANPNNPTGTCLPDAEVRRLRDLLPDSVLLAVDCAYAEYLNDDAYGDPASLVHDYQNVVMTRTFSKIFGLGGLRLGWGYCPPHIADVLNRIRGPFNVSAPAIAAGVAAVRDQAFVAQNRAHNAEERDRLRQAVGGLGFETTQSVGNFILIEFPDNDTTSVRDADQFLASKGIFVRRVEAYGLPNHLRVSIGSREANDAFLSAFEAFVAS